ncbi:MAG: isoprenylcysteine carboxylmethyltransferase family protein [Armatimonadota bacterium]|nr:isoprenylcysteine carboxylmethyltransferase family protein [Armatimonadota bacterium]
MSVRTTEADASTAALPSSKVRRTITWLRVPLVIVGSLLLLNFITDRRLFWMGVPLVLFGEWLQMWSSAHLYKNQDFTTSGPYTYVRNPMYIGRFFLVLGFFVMTGNVPLIIAYIVLYAPYAQVRVKREEGRLAKIFEPHYQHYCSEVPRWLPKLRPYSRAEARRWNWTQMCINNEHLNLIGVLVILVIVYLRIEMLPRSLWNF